MTINTYDAFNRPSAIEKNKIARFLHKHLEQYGDSLTAINKCIDYAIKESPSFGGFILTLKEKSKIVGAVIVNQTGMNDYIPENILVYIAIHNEHRGEGLGRKLMTAALDKCQGSVALHVEHDNPALHLYKNLGFENKYLEMRLTRK
ncbi:MAG: GNAT family N-acetyltransferase [Bacteroidetes bacterium]|nr:GNAT family N-acetyltransferase [Bacteroidota bacterium]